VSLIKSYLREEEDVAKISRATTVMESDTKEDENTDHKPLIHLLDSDKLNPRLRRLGFKL